MRPMVLDLLCCPACGAYPLELTALQTAQRPQIAASPRAPAGARAGAQPRSDDHLHPDADPELDVVTGFLYCTACERFYFIVDGIPRLLTEDFRELIDFSVPDRFRAAFGSRTPQLDAFLDSVSADAPRAAGSTWNVEDVAFWEGEVYGDDTASGRILQRAANARRDAGNRTYPRERVIFSRLRQEIKHGIMLDLGCGLAQAIRTLCPPDEVGYDYIGADLSISALQTNRRTLRGDFIQCTAERVPFRPACVDAVVMLGTLHHLDDHEQALSSAIDAVRAGGWIALDEAVSRQHVARRLRQLIGLRDEIQSAHNESVDPTTIERCLANATETVAMTRLYSPARAVLAHLFATSMETSPRVTEYVLALDGLCLMTMGRVATFFEGREILVLARKRDVRPEAARDVALRRATV